MATRFGYSRRTPELGKEVFFVATKIQALLLVIGAMVAAALNGASPWGP